MKICITGGIGSGKSTVARILRSQGEFVLSADEINAENSVYVSKIFEVIPKIAAGESLGGGYRVITNCGDDACQSVKHLHYHILGGAQLCEKMG